jgi:hypothetical protein
LITSIGAGLGREVGLWALLQVPGRFRHSARVAFHEEHAVRLQVEVAGPIGRVGALQLLPVLHVEPDRRAVLVIHAAVHGEDQLRAERGLAQLVERADGLPVRALPEQPDAMPAQVGRADHEFVAGVEHGPAGSVRRGRVSPMSGRLPQQHGEQHHRSPAQMLE